MIELHYHFKSNGKYTHIFRNGDIFFLTAPPNEPPRTSLRGHLSDRAEWLPARGILEHFDEYECIEIKTQQTVNLLRLIIIGWEPN